MGSTIHNKSQVVRNLLLLSLMPLVFACSKSKFSAAKAPPAPVKVAEQPSPVVPQQPTTPYNPTNPSGPNCNGNCNPGYPPPRPTPPPCDLPKPPPPPYVQPQPRPTPPPSNCKEYEYDAPVYNGPRAMNVWVVMDGSKSNVKERHSQLLSLVTMYEQNLARSMPLTISVITGHSPESHDSVLGGKSLFYVHDSEPAVLTFHMGMSQNQRNKAIRALETKVLNMRRDNSDGISDGGELMTANLLAALKPSNRNRAAQLGAYGTGNILNIHFMSDENDICTKGEKSSRKIPNPETGKQTTSEDYARYKHCGAMDVNAQGYSQTLFNELDALNKTGEAKIYLSGFLYTGESAVPQDGENEVGRGLVELIQASGGRAFDLASLSGQDSYNKASISLASYINKEGNLYQGYQLKNGEEAVNLSKMDRKKTKVLVDGNPVKYQISTANNKIYPIGCPLDAKKVKIVYCNE